MSDTEGLKAAIESLRPHLPEMEAHFNTEHAKLVSLLSKHHDVLGRILKCHLVIEHYIENYLVGHLRIQHVTEARLSFFQKAQLLPDRGQAASFAKPGILKLNSIRNRFGHTLDPKLEMDELGPINEVLTVARSGSTYASPIEAIEAFTTISCTWLAVTPPHLHKAMAEAMAKYFANT